MPDDACPPGGHLQHGRNFTLEDYLAMCSAGEAKFSIAEVARLGGVTRAFLYRCIEMASVPEDVFEAAVAAVQGRGQHTTTAVVDEIRRRTGRAKEYAVTCPCCGYVLRTRRR